MVEGRLLLVRRSNPPGAGKWSIPGGRVERGERLARAVEREVLEETGLSVSCGRFVGFAERFDAEHHFVILDFEVSLPDPAMSSRTRAGDDVSDVSWASKDELSELDTVDGLVAFLDEHDVYSEAVRRGALR